MYSVLFNGLSNHMTPEKLKHQTQQYGKIVSCVLDSLPSSDKLKGTVTFSAFSEAKDCLHSCRTKESLVSKGIVVNYAQDAGKSLGLICRHGQDFKFEKRSQKLSFVQLEAKAKQAYGEAIPRPQEFSQEMLINARRANLGVKVAPVPADLVFTQAEVVKTWDVQHVNLPLFKDSKVFWICTKDQLEFALEYFVTGPNIQAVGLDFEFYNKCSYDGFIAVAVISTGFINLVLDCLYEKFDESLLPDLVKFLSKTTPIKVFHGSDNDALRLQKDFGCFPVAVVLLGFIECVLGVEAVNIDADMTLGENMQTLQTKILHSLTCRFTSDEKSDFFYTDKGKKRRIITVNIFTDTSYILASLLDPRIKTTLFDESTTKDSPSLVGKICSVGTAISLLKQQDDSNLNSDEVFIESPPSASGPESTSKNSTIFSILKVAKSKTCSLKKNNLSCEVETYLSDDFLDEKLDPLVYWKVKCEHFPKLAGLARKFLSIPASSGSVERLFSVAVSIARSKRARLKLGKLEKLLTYQQYLLNNLNR